MQLLTVSLLLGLATTINGAQHQHRQVHKHPNHLRPRAQTTVVDVVTTVVTEYVYANGSPVSPMTSSTSSSSLAIFFQETTTSSTSTTPTSTSKSSSSIVVASTPSAALEAEFLQKPSSTTPVAVIPTTTTAPTVVAPAPSTTAAVVYPTKAGEHVFIIVNSHTVPISTAHDDTSGTPTSAGAPLRPGTMAVGATATFAVPSGWVGNVGINEAKYEVGTDATLIEGNLNEWYGALRADFDVSFVNGFTLPATCSCNGVVTTGCNLNLAADGVCPGGFSNGACANPLRSSETATSADSFFSACEGAAWTFVNDGKADSNCVSGTIECCIGTSCPANPNQS